MTTETDKQLASLIEAAKSTGSDLASFIQQQAPDLAEQIVARHIMEGWIAIGLIFTGLIGMAIAWFLVKKPIDNDQFDGRAFGGFIVGLIAFIMALNGCFGGPFKVMEGHVSPKLVVAEKIGAMIRR